MSNISNQRKNMTIEYNFLLNLIEIYMKLFPLIFMYKSDIYFNKYTFYTNNIMRKCSNIKRIYLLCITYYLLKYVTKTKRESSKNICSCRIGILYYFLTRKTYFKVFQCSQRSLFVSLIPVY